MLNGTGVNGIPGVPITASNVHWIVPAFGQIGNVGRNNFIADGRQDWTFALQRAFNLHSERHQFILRTELFNPFNHPNTGNASTVLAGIQPVLDGKPFPVQAFENFPATVAGQRNIRFWLKYQF